MAVTKANPKDEAAVVTSQAPAEGDVMDGQANYADVLAATATATREKRAEQQHIELLATILAAAPLLMNRASTQAQAGSIQGALMTARELVRINREGQA